MTKVDPDILAEHVAPPRAVYELSVPDSLVYFDGHFPGKPVLPGVVQLHWAVRFARSGLGLGGTFRGIEALKFHRVIEPRQAVTLQLEHAARPGKLYFSFASGSEIHSQGRLLFQ